MHAEVFGFHSVVRELSNTDTNANRLPRSIPDGLSPESLGSGEITRLLGVGGMANVYEIWNAELEIHRAVKLLHPSCDDESLQRFQTETKITAKLHHPNIVEIHSVGKWKGLPFIEMERAEGESLEDLIHKRGALPASVVVCAGILVCRALAYAHNQQYMLYGKKYRGVIHRDLKPSNIMICTSGGIKLMDFGIARPIEASYHTIDGTVIGTLQYLSPEQLKGKALDERTDIYSLGVTLYETLCAQKAFGEPNMSRLMADRNKNRFSPLTHFDLDAPKSLIKAVGRCMLKDPVKRFSSADELREALEKIAREMLIVDIESVLRDYINEQPAKSPVVPKPRRSLFGMRSAAVISGIAALIAVSLVIKDRPSSVDAGGKAAAKKTSVAMRDTTPSPRAKRDAVPEKPDSATRKAIAPSAPSARPKAEQKPAPLVRLTPDSSSIEKTPEIKPPSFLEKVAEETGVSHVADLPAELYKKKRYQDALRAFDSLTAEDRARDIAHIFALRAALALKDNAIIDRFLATYQINDAEYFLAKANRALEQGAAERTLNLLKQAERAPYAASTYEEISLEIALLRAQCASAYFEKNPGEETYNEALAQLRQLRALLRSNRDHPYYAFAREQAQRIGAAYQANQEQP